MDKVLSFYTRVFALASIILSPIFFFLILFRKQSGNNVLVIPQFKRIGDIVCSTPVFRAIKERYPDSRITVIVSSMAAGILKNNPRIDEIIIVEDYWHNFPSVVRKIIRGNFKWGISLSGTPLSSALFFLGLIAKRIKTVRKRRPLTEILTDWLNTRKYLFEDGQYLPGHHLKLLKELGIQNPQEIKEVFLSDSSKEKAANFFKENDLSEGDTLVGISVSAGNKIKEWGDDNWASLGKYLTKEKDAKVLFLGAPSEKERIETLIKKSGETNFYNATAFSIEELPALMSKLSLYIASDTGPIYIAHALGVPLIDIIGPVDPNEQPPEDERSIRVLPPPEFKPTSFVFREAEDKELAKKTTEAIKVPDVIKAANILLK